MSSHKEPHFIGRPVETGIRTIEDCEDRFSHARPEHRVAGEASILRIYSNRAIDEILE